MMKKSISVILLGLSLLMICGCSISSQLDGTTWTRTEVRNIDDGDSCYTIKEETELIFCYFSDFGYSFKRIYINSNGCSNGEEGYYGGDSWKVEGDQLFLYYDNTIDVYSIEIHGEELTLTKNNVSKVFTKVTLDGLFDDIWE